MNIKIKICRLQIWKKHIILDENLNIHYIWQNKTMSFLQSFKRQSLNILFVLVILYFFEAICLIIFLYLQYLEVSNLLIHFSKASLK